MKKNFLMVASLLIAAMLLVVSCTQEVAPVDNGLVEVTLNTSTARSTLTYSGVDIDDVTYRYKLDAKWTPTNADDAVVGETEGYVTLDKGETAKALGYVSQGLWEVEVIGSINNVDVLKGTTQVYFNKNCDKVTVYVKPTDNTNNAQIALEVKVNDHDSGSAYSLYYSIENIDGGTVLASTPMTRGNSTDANGYRTWTASHDSMTSGYYRVTVTMKNGDDVVGGITEGVLLFSGDSTAKLSGSVNSKDFINGTLNIYYPEVTVTVAAGEVEKNSVYSVTYTATANVNTSYPLTVSPTYTWYADGEKLSDENNTSAYNATYALDEPGYKTVTCVVTYTFNIPNANNTADNSTVAFTVQGAGDCTKLVND